MGILHMSALCQALATGAIVLGGGFTVTHNTSMQPFVMPYEDVYTAHDVLQSDVHNQQVTLHGNSIQGSLSVGATVNNPLDGTTILQVGSMDRVITDGTVTWDGALPNDGSVTLLQGSFDPER